MKIILIDDEQDSRFLFQQKFKKWIKQGRVELEYAADFQQGMAFIQSGTYGIYLCDLNLPDGNGFQILQAAKKKMPTTPVFILTGTLDKEQEKACLAEGARAYYIKPIQFDLLLPQIEQILEAE